MMTGTELIDATTLDHLMDVAYSLTLLIIFESGDFRSKSGEKQGRLSKFIIQSINLSNF